MFPKVIYFCNKTLDNININSDKWKQLNPDYEIKLYDNALCEQFLVTEYGQLYGDIFNFLVDGPIKADFWRICVLYKYGGVYSDVDIVPLVPLDSFIEKYVDFVTCCTYAEHSTFNPNFIISHKNDSILKKCIDWYLNKYNKKETYDYWSWSIMKCLSVVLNLDNFDKKDGVYLYDNKQIQIIKEYDGHTFVHNGKQMVNHRDAHNKYNGMRVFNNRSADWDYVNHCFYKRG